MKKLDKDTAQSLTNLRGNPDFQRVLNWVSESRSEYSDICCSAVEDRQVHRAQGGFEATNNIMKNMESAPGVVEKFKQTK